MKKSTNMNNSNATKVICQNCGAEIIIPNHEHNVAGVAIGKDSGLGTVVLPTVGGAKGVNPLEQLTAAVGGNADVLSALMTIVNKIDEGGYLDVDGIVRRWIPSQCLQMVYSKAGFHEALKSRGYDYSWKVLVDELKKQHKLYVAKDFDELNDRNRWYNNKVAADMATEYIGILQDYVRVLREHSHKGRMYKNIRCAWMNKGQGIHLDELSAFWDKLWTAQRKISSAKTPSTLYDAVARFNNLRQSIKFTPRGEKISTSFTNAYKAAGCYYTMKDLIMFEGCLMKVNADGHTYSLSYCKPVRNFVEKEESLKALDRTANEVAASVTCSGYTMLGLLKDFLDYNNFSFDKTKAKWAEQSEIRKAFRNLKRGERRSRK